LGEFGPCKSLFFASISDSPRIRGFINQPQYRDDMNRIISTAPKESDKSTTDACWRLTDFMDAMPKETRSPSECRVGDDGLAGPVLSPEDPGIRAMRADYIDGLKNAVRAYDNGKLPPVGHVLDKLFAGGAVDGYIRTLTGRQK
jgi:hypothetical protein